MEEILDIFNDKLEIIGQDTRKNVHRKGLLHQVVHCWAIEDSKTGDLYICNKGRSLKISHFYLI